MTARPASGRPLRFFGLILLCWVMARVGVHITPIPRVSAEPVTVAPSHPQAVPWIAAQPLRILIATMPPAPMRTRASGKAAPSVPVDLMDFIRPATAYGHDRQPQDVGSTIAAPTAPPFPLEKATSSVRNRWQLSAWALWRPDRANGNGAASVGQLGGSQAGARLDVDLNPGASYRVATYARVTAALGHPTAPEAALGITYQPARRLPVSLALERRIALGEGARDAMAVMALGGFGPTPVIAGLSAEAYGQAGIVGFRANDRFLDGKISLTAPVERLPLRIGASLSGGAQPGIHRMDVGPEIQLQLPLHSAPARLSVEWRERIAGRARPASGLAITLAADF